MDRFYSTSLSITIHHFSGYPSPLRRGEREAAGGDGRKKQRGSEEVMDGKTTRVRGGVFFGQN